jgi:hypothetical protein
MRRVDGKYRWVLNTGTPRFVDSVYVGHIGTVVDITDIKRSHERMLASQKLESLGVLAAGLDHDLNNMLLPFSRIGSRAGRNPRFAGDRQR